MAQVIVTESSLENIAGAIRTKLGTQATYKPAQMAGAIAQIHGDPVLEVLNANANGTYTPSSGKDGFSQAVVNVPNSYSAGDEGKVVSGGALVAQSSQSITQNGTYDTTLKNQAIVNVPNSYSASDEGKVVSGGALVAQSSQTITQNGTYDTTLKNQVSVNVSGGGGGGDSYPLWTEIYSGLPSGYSSNTPTITGPKTMPSWVNSASQDAQNFISQCRLSSKASSSSGGNIMVEITENIAQHSLQEAISLGTFDGIIEYYGYVYNTSLITDYNMVLLGDFSQGGDASGNVLSDSIMNYSAIILQGIYNKQRESNYNTTIVWMPKLNRAFWTGMKDRNYSYYCEVTFTDNTHASLARNRQVIIYGIV